MLARDMNIPQQRPPSLPAPTPTPDSTLAPAPAPSAAKVLKKLKTQTGDTVKSAFEEQLERLHLQAAPGDNYEAAWPRPPLPNIDSHRDAIVFQQIEIDDYVADPPAYIKLPLPLGAPAPVIRMYGVTMAGNSVLAHVHGFFPYFYCPAPRNFDSSHLDSFKTALTNHLRQTGKVPPGPLVMRVETLMKQSIYDYQGAHPSPFLRIMLQTPNLINPCKRALETGFSLPNYGEFRVSTVFESNLAYTLRFMIDQSVPGANWIELPRGSYSIRGNKTCYCQLELDVKFDKFISHAPQGDWGNIAPLRILSFDIECAGRKGHFPDPNEDPVIQIANMVSLQGDTRPFIRNVFTLKKCANIVGTQVLSFENEHEMLHRWTEFILEIDPDILIGYNINGFDFPYLLDRAVKLKASKFPFLGRIRDIKTVAKDAHFQSKGLGARDLKNINIDGRLQLDMLQVMQRDYKLRSYTLNSVCAHFLGEQKEDVHHSIITDLQNGNEETRRRLAVYCLKDAYLPQRLLDKLMIVINYMEMARVTGVPFNYLLTRGQQVKVVSQLYRKARSENLLIPTMHSEGSDEQYEGATVIEPEKGFYNVPIATLDFTSLYPSIMQAHNLCYSTHLQSTKEAESYGLVRDKDYIVSPNGDVFVTSLVKKGLLPTILKDLLDARKKAKADLKKETDAFKKAVLDGRQVALKVSANSVYGFTGATVGKLPMLAISSSVTAYGRVMIEKTKELVEAKFTTANGYKYDAKVVYGDTDSVMVKFGVPSVEEAMQLGREAAQQVTKEFKPPINLDFEKVYFPYLLINKKRYAGLYWTTPEKFDKLDAKGIETVRRDNCGLVKTVIDTSLRMILIDRDVVGAQEFTKGIIADLLQNKIDLSQLVISKALGKAEYASKTAHNELAERMRKRDEGSAPALGDRVTYVIVKGKVGAAAHEKAEDPIFVLEHNIPIDTKYYLENQLSKPLMRIFEPILGEKAQSLLSGEHTRTISIAAPTTGGLMKFAVKSLTCLGCKTLLPKNETAVCRECKPRVLELYMRQVDSVNDVESRFARLWTQCQRCQGSLHQDVICTAADCPIFYMRKKAQKDAKDSYSTLDRFHYTCSRCSTCVYFVLDTRYTPYPTPTPIPIPVAAALFVTRTNIMLATGQPAHGNANMSNGAVNGNGHRHRQLHEPPPSPSVLHTATEKGKKRSREWDPVDHTSSSQIKYRKDDVDWETIHAKTTNMLMSAQKLHHNAQQPRDQLVEPMEATLSCQKCTATTSIDVCRDCSKPTCESCMAQCEACHETFCSNCYVINYEDTFERDFCFSCNETIETNEQGGGAS
ncbi:DNA-directed DNA polymerase [Synchytrium endobioticum]|uniref:DNA polymerase n=1 Tax=Synchytrium endobioticum TaxID=286115 RepID=A0A507DDX5_9FUNG|nr:DNA-directed DNA polymerase [Synchytrium endobioticum]TPX49515.1 DNA-directed DNA polymerase [Synchytrium endobioticum]